VSHHIADTAGLGRRLDDEVEKIPVVEELLGQPTAEIMVFPFEMDDVLHPEDHGGDDLFDEELHLAEAEEKVLVIVRGMSSVPLASLPRASTRSVKELSSPAHCLSMPYTVQGWTVETSVKCSKSGTYRLSVWRARKEIEVCRLEVGLLEAPRVFVLLRMRQRERTSSRMFRVI
jgi:hypothetical protein